MFAQRLTPQIATELSVEDGINAVRAILPLCEFAAAGCATWSPAFRNLTPETLKEAKGLGLQVVPWTVNDKADMERLVDLGVDGLISDYPDRLRTVLAAREKPLPPQVRVR